MGGMSFSFIFTIILTGLFTPEISAGAPPLKVQRVVIPSKIDEVSLSAEGFGFIAFQKKYQAPLPSGILDQIFIQENGKGSMGWLSGIPKNLVNRIVGSWEQKLPNVFSIMLAETDSTYSLLYYIGADPSSAEPVVNLILRNYRPLSITDLPKKTSVWKSLLIRESVADDLATTSCSATQTAKPYEILEDILTKAAQQNSLTRLASSAITACKKSRA